MKNWNVNLFLWNSIQREFLRFNWRQKFSITLKKENKTEICPARKRVELSRIQFSWLRQVNHWEMCGCKFVLSISFVPYSNYSLIYFSLSLCWARWLASNRHMYQHKSSACAILNDWHVKLSLHHQEKKIFQFSLILVRYENGKIFRLIRLLHNKCCH